MKGIIKTSLMMVLVLILLCGVVYPVFVTIISQIAFNHKANGSMVTVDGQVVGSELIGQKFTDARFFKGRPSAVNYNTYEDLEEEQKVASGSSNLAPSNPELAERVSKDIEKFLKLNPTVNKEDIPTDLLTQSASGLDPNISTEGAKVQIEGVSKATGISTEDLQIIVDKHTSGKTIGIFGEERVNVLLVNLEITNILKAQGKL